MTMLEDRTNHNRIAEQLTARLRASIIADKYIPAAGRQVAPTDNGHDDFESLDALERAAITAEAAGPDDDEGELTRPRQVDPDKELKGAREAMGELNGFLTTMPVIETLAQAKDAVACKERSRIALKQLDLERDGKVRPLNEQVKKTNATYKKISEPFVALFDQLLVRLNVFDKAETARREAIAAAARRVAEEAAAAAAAAQARVAEAVNDAAVGAEIDVGTTIEEADEIARDAARLGRQATIAERDSRVRIKSVMGGRATSSRTYRDLIIADVEAACIAIRAMGLPDSVAEAICVAAKAHKATWGELPEGVTETQERRI